MPTFMTVVWEQPRVMRVHFQTQNDSCERCGAAIKSLSPNPFEAARGWKSCDWCDRISNAVQYITTIRLQDFVIDELIRSREARAFAAALVENAHEQEEQQ